MLIKWFGHTSFELKIGEKIICIDPYAGEPDEYVESADILLISNWHYSHCSLDVVKRIMKENTVVLSTRETASEIYGVKVFNPGQVWEFDGIKITAVHAYTLRREGHSKGDGLGFIIEAEGKVLYYMGRTEQIPEMKNIKADIVIAPVGGTYVMDAEEAAAAVEMIHPTLAIPTHYGKIGSLLDAEYFRDILEAKNIKVRILQEAEEVEI